MIALFVSYAIIFSLIKKKKIFKTNATVASKKILELIKDKMWILWMAMLNLCSVKNTIK